MTLISSIVSDVDFLKSKFVNTEEDVPLHAVSLFTAMYCQLNRDHFKKILDVIYAVDDEKRKSIDPFPQDRTYAQRRDYFDWIFSDENLQNICAGFSDGPTEDNLRMLVRLLRIAEKIVGIPEKGRLFMSPAKDVWNTLTSSRISPTALFPTM